MMIAAAHSDRTRERRLYTAWGLLIAAWASPWPHHALALDDHHGPVRGGHRHGDF